MAKETIAQIKEQQNKICEEFIQLLEGGQINLNCDDAEKFASRLRKHIGRTSQCTVYLDLDIAEFDIEGYYEDLIDGDDIEVKIYHKGRHVGDVDFSVRSVEEN